MGMAPVSEEEEEEEEKEEEEEEEEGEEARVLNPRYAELKEMYGIQSTIWDKTCFLKIPRYYRAIRIILSSPQIIYAKWVIFYFSTGVISQRGEIFPSSSMDKGKLR